MKNILYLKYSLALTCLLMGWNSAWSQRIVEHQLEYRSGQKIIFDLPIGKTIKISGWDKNEVNLTATVNINNNRLNDAYHLEIEEGNTIQIKASLDEDMLENGKAEDCPDHYTYQSHHDGKQRVVCADINYELHVPRAATLHLNTISADVEAQGLEGATKIKSISGFIDFNWRAQQEAELALKSITGELYTDLDFDILNKKEVPPIVGYTLKGQIGSGGNKLDLETISSDIYLRKR